MASGSIIRIGLAGCEGSFAVRFDATVNIVINGSEKTDYGITMRSGSFCASSIFTVPLELHQNDICRWINLVDAELKISLCVFKLY